MTRPIPDVRRDLHDLANALERGEIGRVGGALRVRALANDLHRESPVRKTPPAAAKMTPELADRIRRYAEARPRLSQLAIAVVFRVNQGRVSEAMNGKR